MKLLIMSLILSFSAFAEQPKFKVEIDVESNQATSDILFVVDNSGSMHSIQQTIGQLGGYFLNQIFAVDFNITAISTDEADTYSSYVLDRRIPNPSSRLHEMITSFGVNGSANERPFTTLVRFYNSPEGSDFFREGSSKEIIIITDEDDQSLESLEFMNKFTADHKMTVNSIALKAPSFDCSLNRGAYSEKIITLTRYTGGNFIDLCSNEEELITGLKELGIKIAKRSNILQSPSMPIELYVLPENVVIDTVKIYYGSQIIPRGLLKTGWVYDEAEHKILFGKKIQLTSQPEDTKLTIEFEI